MKKIAIVSLLALTSTGVAVASIPLTNTAMNNYQAQSGLYVNGQLGFTEADMPSGFGDTGLVVGPTVGYDFALTPVWMVGGEMGWLYLGQSTNSYPVIGDVTIKNSGFQFLATTTYLLNDLGLPRWNVFGKVGLMDENTDASSGTISADEKGAVAALAFGAGYLITPNVNLTLQYEHVFGDNYGDSSSSDSKPMAQNIFALGVTYKIPLGPNLYNMNNNTSK